MNRKFYNTADHSVVVDDEGHVVDGLTHFEHVVTEQTEAAVERGEFVDLGEAETEEVQDGDQGGDGDTVPPSGENDVPDETLTPQKASKKRKTTDAKHKNKEN